MTWRKHQFKEGARYKVRDNFESSTDSFTHGQILTFLRTAYSRYDGMSGFQFTTEKGDIMSFDVHDDDDLSNWTQHFAEIDGKESLDLALEAKAGINRFESEGFTRWPENKLRVLFGNRSLESHEVQAILNSWMSHGFVTLTKESDCYLEVLRPIE